MKKALLFAAALVVAASASADYYMIGSNVNGKSWTVAAEDAKFADQGNGIYRWEGELLGTGFKINNGSWDDPNYNFGSNGGMIEEGVPYYYGVGGSTGDIGLYECTEVKNPVVVLDENEKTITLTGDFGGTIKWYICGINGDFIADESGIELLPTDTDGEFKAEGVAVTVAEGELKISSTGWATKYGTDNADEVFITDSNLSAALVEVFGEAGNIPYVLTPGNYSFTFNIDELTLVVAAEGGSGVDVIEAEGEAVYYNLQGIRVENPKNGIFVKVIEKKATKVVVAD